MYKKEERDITFDYFQNYNTKENIDYIENIDYQQYNDADNSIEFQYSIFKNMDFTKICPFVRKYFSPSKEILDLIYTIEQKYNIDYSNTCVLFYRGNDKKTETPLCSYEEIIEKANIILKTNSSVQFLIQSDETEFIEKMRELYPSNSFYFKDEIRHMKSCDTTVDIVFKHMNYEFSKLYLAITVIMSKCEYIICGSGNCSFWIMLYRENANNVHQYFQNKWF
jgi:hypothetical protein